MKKNLNIGLIPFHFMGVHRHKIMNKLSYALLGTFLHLSTGAFAQQLNLTKQNASFEEVFKEIKKQTNYNIICNSELLAKAPKINIQLVNKSVDEALRIIFKENGYHYRIENSSIIITHKDETDKTVTPVNLLNSVKQSSYEVSGQVITNNNKSSLAGVSIKLQSDQNQYTTQSDKDGQFKLQVFPGQYTISLSSLGYHSHTTTFLVKADVKNLKVTLHELTQELSETVVTGIYNRNKESFTGSATTYSQLELKQVGGTNILQSLKTLDPAFNIRDNMQFGSDPNRMPNMEIRGKSSMLGVRDGLEADPNQPLFILDGFESSLAAINDIDINRIESITLLKDAASTAIYGSKAANGVVVVETVKPKAGKLQVSYNGNVNISAPDLSSYNLMNAKEKLQFEYLAGRYDASTIETPNRTQTEIALAEQYNERQKAIAAGVDTDWLAEPLQVGINQKHSLYVMGGEGNFMFGLGGGINGITGVMQNSKRSISNGNIDLIYRISKFQFSNKFSLSNTGFTNPVVNFREYASANPYYKKQDADGQVGQWLEYSDNVQIGNPIYNASLNSRNEGNNLLLSNYFVSEWAPTNEWRVRARFGLTYSNNSTENFTSPLDSRQILNKPFNTRGEYHSSNNKGNQYEGELTISYAKMLKNHRFNLVGGANVFSHSSLLQGYSAEGFPAGDFTYPSFANGYPLNGGPQYLNAINRSINGYFNMGYGYDERYLMDVSLRTSGSSLFGSTKKYNTTWSLGLGWNLHREKFIEENAEWINFFKLRGSIGNPGNQSFDSGRTLITYAFPNNIANYFGLGALPNQIGNPNLAWQITNDRNIGLDLTVLNRRLAINIDYYNKITNPLLIGIEMPLSSGTSEYFTNAGEQRSEGLIASASYHIIRNTQDRIIWSLRANARTQKSRIDGIGDKLDVFNNSGRGNSTVRYFDGADPDDIWVIKSAGIDPSTGKELFYTKEGGFTYDFDYDNEVIVGNIRPDVEGIIGTSFTFKGFTTSLNFRYQFGAEFFNYAVQNKVENIDLTTNQDRRALYERWHTAGDIRPFKNIKDVNFSPMTSRFVQTENILSLESIYLEYQFTEGWIKRVGLGNFKLFASMRDAIRMSNIRVERGIDYPFARVIDGGLSFNF